jgi:hypothetical protein
MNGKSIKRKIRSLSVAFSLAVVAAYVAAILAERGLLPLL